MAHYAFSPFLLGRSWTLAALTRMGMSRNRGVMGKGGEFRMSAFSISCIVLAQARSLARMGEPSPTVGYGSLFTDKCMT